MLMLDRTVTSEAAVRNKGGGGDQVRAAALGNGGE